MPVVYRTANEMPLAEALDCGTCMDIRDDLGALEMALKSSVTDLKETSNLSCKLVDTLLKMVQSEKVCKELEFTKEELDRLRDLKRMTKAMRAKFRIYVQNRLRKSIGT